MAGIESTGLSWPRPPAGPGFYWAFSCHSSPPQLLNTARTNTYTSTNTHSNTNTKIQTQDSQDKANLNYTAVQWRRRSALLETSLNWTVLHWCLKPFCNAPVFPLHFKGRKGSSAFNTMHSSTTAHVMSLHLQRGKEGVRIFVYLCMFVFVCVYLYVFV